MIYGSLDRLIETNPVTVNHSNRSDICQDIAKLLICQIHDCLTRSDPLPDQTRPEAFGSGQAVYPTRPDPLGALHIIH